PGLAAHRVRGLQHRSLVGAVSGLRAGHGADGRLSRFVACAQLALVEPGARRADRPLPDQRRPRDPKPPGRPRYRVGPPTPCSRRRDREESSMTSPSTWNWNRIVYGDWTWFVRDSLDVLRLAFVGGAIVFAVQGRSDTVALVAASTVLLIARVINLPRWFDFGLTVAMTLIAWGTALSLYGHWFYYDKVVHSLSPVAYAPVLYIVLVRLGVVPDPGVAIRERRVARIA